jgi:hypothetical protein
MKAKTVFTLCMTGVCGMVALAFCLVVAPTPVAASAKSEDSDIK